jgi:KaiC/GvpD/RAD55 family RecA-like ATPase
MSFDSEIAEPSSVREGRYSIGIKILDTDILRGVPKGSTIAVLGGVEGGSELILHSLAATGRNTEYITTLRSEIGLMDDIKRVRVEDNVDEDTIEEAVTIRDVFQSTDSSGDIIRRSLSLVDDGGNLIVDSFSKYHDDPQDMMDYARKIHTKTKMNGGITYLYFASSYEDLNRYEKEILQMVDGVFNVKTEIEGETIENNLFINKLRGMQLPKDSQNLIFGEKLSIDVTSDIG